MRERKWIWRRGERGGGLEGEEIVIRMYSMRKEAIFNKKERKNTVWHKGHIHIMHA